MAITAIGWDSQNSLRMLPAPADTAALFGAYHDRIYRYVLRLVRDRTEAEDLTQETFLRACHRQDTLRDPASVAGWLYRIATHVCLDRLRRRKPLDCGEEETATSLAQARAATPSPLELTERSETSACVQRCLEALPDSYRALIILYEGHALTAPEIARLLQLNLTTVKMRLHRAHRMLRQVMECGCAVSTDAQGVPACRPKVRVRK